MAVIWITGAQGFIGRHLALYVAARGHRVFGIGHGIWPEFEHATWGLTGWVSGNVEIANLELMGRSSGLPDKVFHLAGGSSVAASIVNPLEDFQRTVAATAQLLEWLRTQSPATSLVAVSSAAVYGSRYSEPIPEDGSVEPFSPLCSMGRWVCCRISSLSNWNCLLSLSMAINRHWHTCAAISRASGFSFAISFRNFVTRRPASFCNSMGFSCERSRVSDRRRPFRGRFLSTKALISLFFLI